MKIRVIITGATGMVGEGVLHECLQHEAVEHILAINRNPCGIQHPKLKEIIPADFFDLSIIENQLTGYNACFFCLGVSAVGMTEQEYYKLTYSLTLNMAEILSRQNNDMIFCYISGAGTDSSEKGRMMWARVKGKTENDLLKLSFKQVYNFRPGYMQPTKGLKNTLSYYKFLSWLYPVFRFVLPKYVSTLKELGLAMIQVTIKGYAKNMLEVKDIVAIANEK
jgi:nucleoside-diphosphate-sugar epimerase